MIKVFYSGYSSLPPRMFVVSPDVYGYPEIIMSLEKKGYFLLLAGDEIAFNEIGVMLIRELVDKRDVRLFAELKA